MPSHRKPRRATFRPTLIRAEASADDEIGDENVADEQPELLPRRSYTVERRGYVAGLFKELDTLLEHHIHLVAELATLQGQIETTERNLRNTRDYLQSKLSLTKEEVPADWQIALARVRFVGARLGDALLDILRNAEGRGMTTEQLEFVLNSGQFRFRTGSPLREIHAALIRQPDAERRDDRWQYKPAQKGGSQKRN